MKRTNVLGMHAVVVIVVTHVDQDSSSKVISWLWVYWCRLLHEIVVRRKHLSATSLWDSPVCGRHFLKAMWRETRKYNTDPMCHFRINQIYN